MVQTHINPEGYKKCLPTIYRKKTVHIRNKHETEKNHEKRFLIFGFTENWTWNPVIAKHRI
jgi:hypothetical protein